jgi:2'-5' RNA ligase
VRLRPGPLVVFGTGPFVLALGVVPSQGLVALHRALATALRPARGHLEPGAWTPHVTLANRLSAGQVGAALEVLAAWDRPADLVVASARHWDSGQQLDEPLG